jgi:hypothetical protein
MEGIAVGVANVERDSLAPPKESPRLLNSNPPERRAPPH